MGLYVLNHSSSGDREDTIITHLIIIIKLKVSAFAAVVIFSPCCVPEIVVPPCAVRFVYNYISGLLGFVLLLVCSIMSTYTTGWSYAFVCLHITLPHYHHCENVIWRYWPSKMLVSFGLSECVSKIESVLPVIFYAIYGAGCIQLTHLSYADCENMCTLFNYHHEIGIMTNLPLYRVRSWEKMVCVVYPSIFLYHISRHIVPYQMLYVFVHQSIALLLIMIAT